MHQKDKIRQIRRTLMGEWDINMLVVLALECFEIVCNQLDFYDVQHPVVTLGSVFKGINCGEEELFYRNVTLTWMVRGKGTITANIENLFDKNDYLPLKVEVIFGSEKDVFELKYN